jgi:hypothetical protein
MDLTLREGYWIRMCMKLIAVVSLDNFYSPLIRQFFLIANNVNEFMDLRP